MKAATVALLTVDTFDDPEITLGRFPQNGECLLIRWTIVCSDCLSEALKFNHYGVLFDAVFIRPGRDTAGEEAPCLRNRIVYLGAMWEW